MSVNTASTFMVGFTSVTNTVYVVIFPDLMKLDMLYVRLIKTAYAYHKKKFLLMMDL